MNTKKGMNVWRHAMLVLAAVLSLASISFANNCTSLYYSGPSEFRHDIVFVGSGYSEAELDGKYYTDIKQSIDYMLNMTPYKEYKTMFNVWYVNQSADLNCYYSSSMWACSDSVVDSIASQCPRDGGKSITLINNATYGGSSNLYHAECYTGTYKTTCVAHEYGHAFGELMDEYNATYPGSLYWSGANCALASEANYVNDTTPCTKWQNVSGSGCYASCSGYALYRPTYQSIMRTLSFSIGYFNNVSAIQLRTVFKRWMTLGYDYASTNTNIFQNNDVNFSLSRVNDSDNSTIRWYINGTEQTGAMNQTTFTHTFTQMGSYNVSVALDKGVLTDNNSWMVTVNEVNNAPEITNYAPVGDVAMEENSAVDFMIVTNDPDNDTITYSWKLDSQEVATSQNWTYSTNYSSAGNHTVNVTISDGQLTDSQSWNVNVSNVNRAPSITSSPNITVEENQTYAYYVQATDPDSDTLSYGLIAYPTGMSIDGQTITWVPDHTQIGIHSVQVMVNDSTLNATQNFNITVTAICAPNWTIAYTTWGACQSNDTRERVKYYYDANSCGQANPYSNETESEACDYCTPNWVLNSTWSTCVNNTRQKNYYDSNNCNEGTAPAPVTESCGMKATVCGGGCGGNYPNYAGYIWTEPITASGSPKRTGYGAGCDESQGWTHYGIFGDTNTQDVRNGDPYWTYWTAFCSNKPDAYRLCSGGCGNGYDHNAGSIWVEKGTAGAPKNSVFAQGCTGDMSWKDNDWISVCSKEDDMRLCTHACGGKYSVLLGRVWLPQGNRAAPKNSIYGEGCTGTAPEWRSDWWVLLCSAGDGTEVVNTPPKPNPDTLKAPLCVDGCGGDYPYNVGHIWSEPVSVDGWPKRLSFGDGCAQTAQGTWHNGIFAEGNTNLKHNDQYWTYWTVFCANKPDQYRLCSVSCGGEYPYYGGSIIIDKGVQNAPKNSVYAQGCTGDLTWKDDSRIALCSKNNDVMLCQSNCGGEWPVSLGAVWLPKGTQNNPGNQVRAEGCTGSPAWRDNEWVRVCTRS